MCQEKVLWPFALCRIISQSIKLMTDFSIRKCSAWPVLLGSNSHFNK